MQKNIKLTILVLLTLILLPLLSAMTLFTSEPQGGLPDRPTAVPQKNPGALITLNLESEYAGYWTEIQWQDPSTEKWTTVDGWQGHTNENGDVTWWVSPADLGSGPFRWQVFTAMDDTASVMTSNAFNLPTGRTLDITIETE